MALKLTYMWNIVAKLAKLRKSILSRVTPSNSNSNSKIQQRSFAAEAENKEALEDVTYKYKYSADLFIANQE